MPTACCACSGPNERTKEAKSLPRATNLETLGDFADIMHSCVVIGQLSLLRDPLRVIWISPSGSCLLAGTATVLCTVGSSLFPGAMAM